MDQRDHCNNVQIEGKEALEPLLDMCSADLMRNFNKNFTLCNYKF